MPIEKHPLFLYTPKDCTAESKFSPALQAEDLDLNFRLLQSLGLSVPSIFGSA